MIFLAGQATTALFGVRHQTPRIWKQQRIHLVQPCEHDDSMMDHVIPPCRSCDLGRSNTTDVEPRWTRLNQAATFVPIPYHCWHAYLIRTRATAVSFPYAFIPLCFHPCISRPKDHLHASHPQPLLTFLALRLNDIMRWLFVYIICNLKESKTCVIICT